MQLIQESPLADYLLELEEVDFSNDAIQEQIGLLGSRSAAELDYIRNAYAFVRDAVSHSWDIQSRRVTCSASEALAYREGICYAKSNLLAALLRGRNIPAGFCYQRLTLGDTPESGYCIHALNAVYIQEAGRWVRLDARGNKPGIQAEFAIEREQLAFPVRTELDEIDYEGIYAQPHPATLAALKQHDDGLHMYLNGLPDRL